MIFKIKLKCEIAVWIHKKIQIHIKFNFMLSATALI